MTDIHEKIAIIDRANICGYKNIGQKEI